LTAALFDKTPFVVTTFTLMLYFVPVILLVFLLFAVVKTG